MKPRHIKCEKCGYEWDYRGIGYYAKCHRCSKFNKAPRIKAEGEQDEE